MTSTNSFLTNTLRPLLKQGKFTPLIKKLNSYLVHQQKDTWAKLPLKEAIAKGPNFPGKNSYRRYIKIGLSQAVYKPEKASTILSAITGLPVIHVNGFTPTENNMIFKVFRKLTLDDKQWLKQRVTGVILGGHGEGYKNSWNIHPKKGIASITGLNVKKLIKRNPHLGDKVYVKTCSNPIPHHKKEFFSGCIMQFEPTGKSSVYLLSPQHWTKMLKNWNSECNIFVDSPTQLINHNGYHIDTKTNKISPKKGLSNQLTRIIKPIIIPYAPMFSLVSFKKFLAIYRNRYR